MGSLRRVGRTVIATGGVSTPSLERLHNGDLLVSFRRIDPATGEWNGEVLRSRDCGLTWSQPIFRTESKRPDDPPGFFPYNGMAQLPGGTILLPCMGSNRGVFLFRSEDNGESWEGPDRVGEGLDGVEDWQGLYPYGKIRLLTDGTVIMPVSGRLRDTGEHLTAHMRSSDDGWTWDEFVVLSTGIVNYNETIELPNGRLMAMVEIDDEASTQNLNDSPPDGMSPFFWTWSEDQGRTWSELEEAVEPIYGQSPSLFLTQRGTLICGHRWLGDLDQGYVGVAFSVYKPEKGRDGVWNGTPTIVWLGRILNSNYPGRPIHRDYSWAGYPSITYVDDERILCAYFMSWRGGGDSTAQDIEGVYYVEED